MNTPAPGWLPDPTGRHEYRYWDGSQWTDDVSDQGNVGADPVAGPAATTIQGGLQGDPTAAYGDATTAYGPPTAQYGAGAYGAPAPQAPRPGPPVGLIVGLVILVLALIGGVAFVVTSQGDDDSDTAASSEDISDSSDATTTTVDGGSDDGSATSTGIGDAGTEAMTQIMADTFVSVSEGVLTQDEAQCLASGMIEEIGADRLIEAGTEATQGGGVVNPFEVLTADEMSAVAQVVFDCVPTDKLDDLTAVFGDLAPAAGSA